MFVQKKMHKNLLMVVMHMKNLIQSTQDARGGNEELDAIAQSMLNRGMSVQDIAAAEKEAGSDSNSRMCLRT